MAFLEHASSGYSYCTNLSVQSWLLDCHRLTLTLSQDPMVRASRVAGGGSGLMFLQKTVHPTRRKPIRTRPTAHGDIERCGIRHLPNPLLASESSNGAPGRQVSLTESRHHADRHTCGLSAQRCARRSERKPCLLLCASTLLYIYDPPDCTYCSNFPLVPICYWYLFPGPLHAHRQFQHCQCALGLRAVHKSSLLLSRPPTGTDKSREAV